MNARFAYSVQWIKYRTANGRRGTFAKQNSWKSVKNPPYTYIRRAGRRRPHGLARVISPRDQVFLQVLRKLLFEPPCAFSKEKRKKRFFFLPLSDARPKASYCKQIPKGRRTANVEGRRVRFEIVFLDSIIGGQKPVGNTRRLMHLNGSPSAVHTSSSSRVEKTTMPRPSFVIIARVTALYNNRFDFTGKSYRTRVLYVHLCLDGH